jgi:Ca2+-binding RTX toxin-like protein
MNWRSALEENTMHTQTTDVYNTTADGLDISSAGFQHPLTWTIAAGILVSSTEGFGVYSDRQGSTLFNFGQVFAGANDGVLFLDDDGIIVNKPSAAITAQYIGVAVDGNHETIDNLGSITGLTLGVAFYSGSNNTSLTNHGSIYGHLVGVEPGSANEGGAITNLGVLRSDQVGIDVNTHTGLTTSITNAITGTIIGPFAAIQTEVAGDISLINHGTILGNIICTVMGADDSVINQGKIHGSVSLGSGNDTFDGIGGKSGSIDGGDGNDTLTGGSGADRFVFNTALNAVTNVDTITNFTPSQHDKIVLSEAVFGGLGPHGTLTASHFHLNHAGPGASPQIIYTQSNGHLFYDVNGSLPGGMTHFATLTSHPVIQNTDFIVVA